MTVLEPWLREILRCPACRAELADGTGPQGGAELVCTNHACALAYRVDDGVPVLLVDEARPTRDVPPTDGPMPDAAAADAGAPAEDAPVADARSDSPAADSPSAQA